MARVEPLAALLFFFFCASVSEVNSDWTARSLSRTRLRLRAQTQAQLGLFSAANMEATRLALLEEQEKVLSGAAPSCQGLVKQMCKACPQGGPSEFCKNTNQMCGDLFCSPMCRRQTWTCSISFGSLTEESKDPSYEKALCAQFIAYGCQKILDCCPLHSDLYDYVENWAFQDKYPDTRLPSFSCVYGPNPKLCAKCNAAVKVKLKPKAKCPYPNVESSFVEIYNEHREREEAMPIRPPRPKEWSEPERSFLQVTEWAGAQPTGFKKGMFPGPPAHKAPQERCTKLLAKVKSKFGQMQSEFQQNACKCLGCCEGECFYPVTESFPADPDAKT